jgi:hypothetical protein
MYQTGPCFHIKIAPATLANVKDVNAFLPLHIGHLSCSKVPRRSIKIKVLLVFDLQMKYVHLNIFYGSNHITEYLFTIHGKVISMLHIA